MGLRIPITAVVALLTRGTLGRGEIKDHKEKSFRKSSEHKMPKRLSDTPPVLPSSEEEHSKFRLQQIKAVPLLQARIATKLLHPRFP